MCGVVAYYSNETDITDLKLVKNLMHQSKIRGLHSFGIAYKHKDKIVVNKKFDVTEVPINETTMFIGHNRYSTSGNWKEHNNNQPIEHKDSYLVFNGVIDMGTKEEIENKYNIVIESDNDGEIFIQQLQKKVPEKIIKDLNCSFAGAFIKDNKIYCIRNAHRPLWVYVRDESVFIASTKDIFTRCGINNPQPIKENNCIELKDFIGKRDGVQEVSYPNDGKWGYRSGILKPLIHSK